MSTLELAEHIARCLDEDKLDYAVGGALALTVHALPRDTADVDISILVAADQLPRVFDALERAGVMIAGDRRLALLDDLQARFS